jgi:hypothetical protein
MDGRMAEATLCWVVCDRPKSPRAADVIQSKYWT